MPLAAFYTASGLLGCPSAQPVDPAVAAAEQPPAELVCEEDQTREHYCDVLFTPVSGTLAPEPFEVCPLATSPPSESGLPATEPILLDREHTRRIRQLMNSPSSCCYGWCDPIQVVRPDPDANLRCQSAAAFREEYCIAEPEAGSSIEASAPFDRCPAAVKPKEARVFRSPKAANFDLAATQKRRQNGLSECCYAWCSDAPAGSKM